MLRLPNASRGDRSNAIPISIHFQTTMHTAPWFFHAQNHQKDAQVMLYFIMFFMLGQASQVSTAYWVVFGFYVAFRVFFSVVEIAKLLKGR